MLPLPARASAHNRESACGPHGDRRPRSTSTATLPGPRVPAVPAAAATAGHRDNLARFVSRLHNGCAIDAPSAATPPATMAAASNARIWLLLFLADTLGRATD